MLNGVGGRTVAEAKASVSYAEFLEWCKFRSMYGSLHIGMRVDRAVSRAMAAHFNTMSKGKKFKPLEFSPFDVAKEKVDVDDPEAMFNALKDIASGQSRNTDS